ncbi:MAG: DUF1080 domain-containing protein [Pirellulales bacterium]
MYCTGKPIGELRTKQMFQNFELELEWRHMVPRGNAGIFVWADDITSKGVPFHRGVEVQVLENAYGNSQSHTTHGDIFPIHGAKMTPINGRGGSRAFPTEERSKPSPEWNHYRIVCNDGTISLAVNGKVVTQGKEASPRKGYICIESEGGVVEYRNMRLKVLPDSPVDAKDTAIADRGYRSVYSGLDLRGWKLGDKAADSWKANDWVLAFDGKASSGDAALALENSAEIKGALLDFQFGEKSEVLRLNTPWSKDEIVVQAAGDKMFAAAIAKAGSWNRLEISPSEKELTLKLNDSEFTLKRNESGRGLSITADGPVQLANLYVR